jgi:multiple inositol-polyphosphate phosphatase/2,3-bisphosphoglycerate 3-phosphatase
MAGHLCARGEAEMYGIGQRMAQRYAAVLAAAAYNPSHIRIESSRKPRTAQSAAAFAVAMLAGGGSLGEARLRSFSVLTNGKQLRPFEFCDHYETVVKDSEDTLRQQREYLKEVMPVLTKKVAARLGVPTGREVSAADVWAAWNACHYEVVVHNRTDTWCTVFDEGDAEALEFSEDLMSYMRKGRGNAVSWRVVIPLVQDIMENIEAVLAGDGERNATAKLRFAHAETVLPLVAFFDIHTEPEALSAGWTPERIRTRLWRDSVIAPFSANFALGLYDCGRGGDGSGDGVVVQPMLNERPVAIPRWCSLGGGTVCKIDELRALVAAGLLGESWDEMCTLKPCEPSSRKEEVEA